MSIGAMSVTVEATRSELVLHALPICPERFRRRRKLQRADGPRRSRACAGPDGHRLVALTFLHHKVAERLLELSNRFPLPPLSAAPPPPSPFLQIPELPSLAPATRRILESLTGKADLVRVLDQVEKSVDCKVEVERALVHGIPLAFKCNLGGEWGLDGDYWQEMKAQSASWSEAGHSSIRKDRSSGERDQQSGTMEDFLQSVGNQARCYLQVSPVGTNVCDLLVAQSPLAHVESVEQDFPHGGWFSELLPKTFAGVHRFILLFSRPLASLTRLISVPLASRNSSTNYFPTQP